jgi:hypothetical protein
VVKERNNYYVILIHPPLSIPTIGFREESFKNNLTFGRCIYTMEEWEGFSTSKIPRFNGSKYVFWKVKMK